MDVDKRLKVPNYESAELWNAVHWTRSDGDSLSQKEHSRKNAHDAKLSQTWGEHFSSSSCSKFRDLIMIGQPSVSGLFGRGQKSKRGWNVERDNQLINNHVILWILLQMSPFYFVPDAGEAWRQVHHTTNWHFATNWFKRECLAALCRSLLHPHLGVEDLTSGVNRCIGLMCLVGVKMTQNGVKHPEMQKETKVLSCLEVIFLGWVRL